jgi:arylsulfatase A-like enzyme
MRDADNNSDWHGEQVINFLSQREASGEKKPFMIFYGFTHPHDPRYGKPELLEKYGAVNELKLPAEPDPNAPPLQVNWLPAHPFHHGHPGLRDEERVQGVMTNRDETTIRNELGREYACIENIDIHVGRVLDKLEEMGELENTYIMYTADHGIAVGRHGLTGKQNMYEHTWRVPFIVRGPGIKPGSRATGNTYLLDVLPTLCDLAGIEIPETADGKSFKPVLMGEQETIRDIMYGVYCGGTKPGMRAVKKGKWKLIKYDVLDGEVRETQLFNLEENPEEFLVQHQDPEVSALTGVKPEAHQVNLADDPAYADKRKELEELLLEEMKKWGDPYRLWDQPAEDQPAEDQDADQ